jgi:carboxyl-terminal processing protease
MSTAKRCFCITLAILVSVSSMCSKKGTPTSSSAATDEFTFAANLLKTFFIFPDSLPPNPFAFATPQLLYASVREPYTVYLPPDSVRRFLDRLTSQDVGMGVQLDSAAKGYVVKVVFPHSPAQAAGLLQGDTIDSVDGASTAGRTFGDIAAVISGAAGDARTVHVLRGEGSHTLRVTLGSFLAPTVFTDSLAPGIAYILLTSFFSETALPGGTAEEFAAALASTANKAFTILDLRGNPGGEIDQAVAVAGQFVPAGTPIIDIHERFADTVKNLVSTLDTVLVAASSSFALQRRFVALVDSFTASAAEMLVACLMSNRPDILTVGTRTFGKARGQILETTPDTGLARVTYALLKPVRGAAYDLVGIVPAKVVATGEEALAAAEQIVSSALAKRLVVRAGRLDALRAMYGRKGMSPTAIKRIN